MLKHFTNALQWETGANRFVLSKTSRFEYPPSFISTVDISHKINVLTESQIEYALNAVNQGVTALGIKGMSALAVSAYLY